MKKGQTSVRDGIEDFLCPFTDMYITQGANGSFSHKGTMANDVRGLKAGVKYPYYAPCTVKCVRVTSTSNGEATWQSVNKVRFSNGIIDYATFETCHDNTFNAKVGMIVKQGQQLGNMGDRGGATGVHCHIQISQGKSTTFKKNEFGILTFAYSTILGWNYYGRNCCRYIFGHKSLPVYQALWIAVIFVGTILTEGVIWTIADILNAAMVLPNMLAVLWLRKEMVEDTKYYLDGNRLEEEDPNLI